METSSVSSLVCHKDMSTALVCLGSLREFSAEPVSLFIHDDGSLTDQDVALLEERLRPQKIVRRKEADERMAEELRRFPASAAYRRGCVMGLKLCDSVYYNTAPIYAYCDSDILFLKPVRGFFDLPDARFNSAFMQDPHNTYSCRSWQLLLSPKLRLPQKFNAGLGCLRREKYDPEFIEWFLSNPRHRGSRHPGVPEQTAWAALAMRAGLEIYDPVQVAMVRPGFELTDETAVLHVVGMHRSLLGHYVEQSARRPRGKAAVEIRRRAARRCTSLHLLGHDLGRVSDRLVEKLKRAGR